MQGGAWLKWGPLGHPCSWCLGRGLFPLEMNTFGKQLTVESVIGHEAEVWMKAECGRFYNFRWMRERSEKGKRNKIRTREPLQTGSSLHSFLRDERLRTTLTKSYRIETHKSSISTSNLLSVLLNVTSHRLAIGVLPWKSAREKKTNSYSIQTGNPQ